MEAQARIFGKLISPKNLLKILVTFFGKNYASNLIQLYHMNSFSICLDLVNKILLSFHKIIFLKFRMSCIF